MFPADIASAFEFLGLDPSAWRSLKVAVLLEAVLADGKPTPAELVVLLRQSSNSQLYEKLVGDQRLRQEALNLLDRVLHAVPLEEAQEFVEDLQTAFSELARTWHHEQATGPHLVFREVGDDPVTASSCRNWKALSRLTERYLTGYSQEKLAPSARVAASLPCGDILSVPRDARDRKWAEECLTLLENAAKVLETRWTTKGVCFAKVRTIAELANTGFSGIVYHRGVGFAPSKATQGKTIYFVGDVHGDLDTLAQVLATSKVSRHEDVMLVFCGDYVDRGNASLEVLLALLAMVLHYPGRVVVLRGNHDGLVLDRSTHPYSWRQETTDQDLLDDLREHDKAFAGLRDPRRLIRRIFCNMPTFLLFECGVCACHGGPIPRFPEACSNKGTVDEKYRRRISVDGVSSLLKSEVQRVSRWIRTDFRQETFFVWNNQRPPAGFDFGDVEAFLRCIGGKLLIRGHDHVPEGFRISNEAPFLLTLCSWRDPSFASNGGQPAVARCDESTNWTPVKVKIDGLWVGGEQNESSLGGLVPGMER